MHKRKSFIISLFLILLVLLLLILNVAGIGIYTFARQSVGEEFIRLNQASLSQLASATGQALADAISFGEQVSVSSKILQRAALSGETAEKEVHSVLTQLLAEFNAYHTNGHALSEAYVIGCNGLNVSAYYSSCYTWESLQADERCAPLFHGETDMILLPTSSNLDSNGIMTYSFQIIKVMRDLLNGDALGFVVLDLSEIFLYNEYQDYAKDDVQLSIITQDGKIVSNKNKQLIGADYGLNEEALEQLASYKRVSKRIVDGQFLLYERIPASNWLLVEQLPSATAFEPLNQLRNAILTVMTVCTVLAICAVLIISRSLLSRVMRIHDKMEDVTKGDLTARIPVIYDDEFGHIETAFNSMVEEINRLISEVRQSEQQKRMAEMDFLHAQINSHFIYNTLTSIRFMLEMGKVQEAGEMVFYFSKLLRQTLSRSDEFIPLSEELDTLKSYVELQKYRYQDAFEVDYDVDDDVVKAMVPTLILQPVVENAIFHGIGCEYIHIHISGHRKEANLVLSVEDDGKGMSDEAQQSVLKKDMPLNHIGLKNIHERIQMNYGKEYGLTIKSQLGRGTVITYTLPFNLPKEGTGL